MKRLIYPIMAVLAMSIPLMPVGCQNDKAGSGKIKVPAELQSYADKAAGMDYTAVLRLAEKGDLDALAKLLDFHRYADGNEANMHSDVMLELMAKVGDEVFATACSGVKPKLKPIVLERMVFAQGRSKRPELMQPIHEQAPATFAMLTNKPWPGTENMGSAMPEAAPEGTSTDAATTPDAVVPAAEGAAQQPTTGGPGSLMQAPASGNGALQQPAPPAEEQRSGKKKQKG